MDKTILPCGKAHCLRSNSWTKCTQSDSIGLLLLLLLLRSFTLK
jgi:hypothetical protein